MYNLIIFSPAAEELKEASDWYELRQTGLSKRFQKQVFYKLRSIQKNPFIYAVKFLEVFRFAKLDVFPFFIVFEIVGNDILINSIFNTSRDPGKFWSYI